MAGSGPAHISQAQGETATMGKKIVGRGDGQGERGVWRLAVFVLGSLVATGMLSAPVRAEDKPATLSLINPGIELKGVKIKRITATLDGRNFGGCTADQRQPGNVCIKPGEIHSGPHVLEILLDPQTSAYFTSVDKFVAGTTGDWVLDLQGLTVADAKTSDYLTVKAPLAPADGCLAALERVATSSSCTLSGISALGPKLGEAARACSGGKHGRGDAVVHALDEIIDDHFGLSVGQCHTSAERKKLPRRLIGYAGDDAWPENTLSTSSWSWARDMLPKLPSDADAATVLSKLQAALPDLAKRVAAVDGVVNAYLTGDAGPVVQQARSAPWSLDPAKPEGNRNILLLTDPRRFSNAAYSDFVAAKVAADADIDCARTPWEAKRLVEYFTWDEKLSAAGWKAIVAMSERVPADREFGACARAFIPSLDSPVTAAERAHRYFQLDCSQERAPAMRGAGLRMAFRSDSNFFYNASPGLRDNVKANFASCLAASQQAATASMSAAMLNTAVERGCKIGPAAQCSNADLTSTDLHGADLHDAKLSEARLEKANLQGANLQAADLRRAVLDGAMLAGANLKGADLSQVYARKTDLHGLHLEDVGKMQEAQLVQSDLHGANLHGVALTGASLLGANLEGANLGEADLSKVRLEGADLKNADLRGAKLVNVSLKKANLAGADLRGAHFEDVVLIGANLVGANLAGVALAGVRVEEAAWTSECTLTEGGKCAGIDLHSADLQNASLKGIDLHGANLRNARLTGAWLENADLHGADMHGADAITTIFRGANLEGATLEGGHIGNAQFGGANLSNFTWIDGKKCKPGTVGDDC
jgi:uncharacterized protein YjbI with pentapeptide repeats